MLRIKLYSCVWCMVKKSNSFFEAEWQSNTRIKQHSAAAACAHNFCLIDLGWKYQKAKSGVTSLPLEGRRASTLLTASECAFLALKRIHSFRGITSIWKLLPSTEQLFKYKRLKTQKPTKISQNQKPLKNLQPTNPPQTQKP